MSSADLIIRGKRVVLPTGAATPRSQHTIAPASIHIRDGRIVAIGAHDDATNGSEVFEADEQSLVMAGLVDTHVHINEPGRTEWEGFWTATRAAAAGGVTTLVDMPLNSIPPTTTADALAQKLDACRGQLWVDVAFWGGVVPGNVDELAPLAAAGVLGCKAFLC